MEKLLKISEVAEILGVTTQTLRKWDKAGKFTPTHTVGGHRRYRLSDVEKVIAGTSEVKKEEV